MNAIGIDVEPRVISPGTGDRIRLVDAVENLLCNANRGILRLRGQRVEVIAAIERLGSAFCDQICDGTEWNIAQIAAIASQRIVIVSESSAVRAALSLQLVPWDGDEILDYLVAHHRQECAWVREKIQKTSKFWRPTTANGWRLALSTLALNPRCKSLKQAVEFVLDSYCRTDARVKSKDAPSNGVEGRPTVDGDELAGRTPPTIQSLISGDCAYSNCMMLRHWILCMREKRFPWNDSTFTTPQLVEEMVLGIQEESIDWRFMLDPRRFDASYQHLAATLISKLDPKWRPDSKRWALLGKGNFDGVTWSDFHFEGNKGFLIQFRSASFIRAHLRAARLKHLGFQHAAFMSADLQNAVFEECDLTNAEFSGASLSEIHFKSVNAPDSSFRSADLTHASLDSCNLISANFASARLHFSMFVRAALTNAIFSEANLENALFKQCSLNQCDLTTAKLDGASFQDCAMHRCNFENVRAAGIDFDKSDLKNAWFTGSVLRNASFQGANLQHAALGEVDWERADLRGANLSQVTFHFGSTRCGLVDSPYPSHGTRTGFYTDDFDDQPFKSPEEIRKANLRGADLRGAILGQTDFYLVDLRDAQIDPHHIPHLKRCGAILESRC